MFSTSMATWLEPSHLGDVIKRIKQAFAEAVAHQPAILFIDEIDGIGRRTDFTRDYADYWNALVNCLLELLDGAARTTGVIVIGATNHSATIDPALLRPGRLSPHMKISPPDVTARMGILRHHLGGDLASIIATAPKPAALASEDELRGFLHTLPDAVLRDLAENGIEHLARKGTPSGRAAEEEILGLATSNSGGSEHSDLGLATRLALDMETVLGFSRKWPLLHRRPKDGAAILGTDLDLAQRVHARLASAHKAARDIVRRQKTALQFLADMLLARETLEGPELDAVLEQVRQKMVGPPARR